MERIKKINDQVKIVVLLRDPVERFISHYKQLIRNGCLSKMEYKRLNIKTFYEAGNVFPELIDHGRYYSNLKPYIEAFGNENIDIVIKNDLDKNILAEIRKVHNFLGVDPNFILSIINKEVSPGIIPRFQILEALRMRLFFDSQ